LDGAGGLAYPCHVPFFKDVADLDFERSTGVAIGGDTRRGKLSSIMKTNPRMSILSFQVKSGFFDPHPRCKEIILGETKAGQFFWRNGSNRWCEALGQM